MYFEEWKSTKDLYLCIASNFITKKHSQTSNISHTVFGNKMFDHSDVVGV